MDTPTLKRGLEYGQQSPPSSPSSPFSSSSSSSSSIASKRPKGNDASGPSRVVHIRSLPTHCLDHEVTSLCTPFGTIQRFLFIQNNQQCFIQFQDANMAAALVNYYAANPQSIRGRPIFFQHSNRETITETSSSSASSDGGGSGGGGEGEVQNQPNSVLLVSFLNVEYVIVMDHIHQIFSRHGTVSKIVTFQKNNDFKALVQMSTLEEAVQSRLAFDGKQMFKGCNTLRVNFSTLPELVVKQNTARAMDFTQQQQQQQRIGGGSDMSMLGGANKAAFLPNGFGQMGGSGGGMVFSSGVNLGQQQHQQSQLFGFDRMGGNAYTKNLSLGNNAGGYMNLMNSNLHLGMQQQQDPHGLMGGHLDYARLAQIGGPGCVLLVNNLPPQGITPDMLFILFGVYGDVLRVKILFNKRETALVQFRSAQDAATAATNLNKVEFFGQELHINVSNGQSVAMPKGQEEELTKEYSDSPIHRFKKGTRNAKNVFPPSQVLHVANVPEQATETDLRNIFMRALASSASASVSSSSSASPSSPVVQFFHSTKKQAYVRVNSVSDAVICLMTVHNSKLANSFLRVSFTKKDPLQVTDTEGTPLQYSGTGKDEDSADQD